MFCGCVALGSAQEQSKNSAKPKTATSDLTKSVQLKYAPAPVDNPLKGLVPYANPKLGLFPHSMEFNYLPLSKLVTGKNRYDFSALEKMLNQIASHGNQTVFRIFLEYPGKKNCIPKYLVDGGLKVHKYKNTNTEPFPPQDVETPDYEDANLRACMKGFLKELGKRYDGDPRIGYITAGLLGTWGEWHTYPKTELWASKRVQNEVLTAYESAFSKTPILLRYPAGEDDFHYAPTHKRKFGYHDDSFAFATLDTGKKEDSWYFQTSLRRAKLEEIWKKYPIGGEIRPEVWACCFDEKPCTKPDQSFADCRDQLHATWMMETGMFKKKNDPVRQKRAIDQVRKMGYEFHISEVTLSAGELKFKVKNTGIAPFYHPGWKIELGRSVGKEIQEQPTDLELIGILPGQTKTLSYKFENPSPEKSSILIRVPNPMKGGKPVRFANSGYGESLKGWLMLIE